VLRALYEYIKYELVQSYCDVYRKSLVHGHRRVDYCKPLGRVQAEAQPDFAKKMLKAM